ncbi:MAG: DEAD/DEAH box helicase family protein [Clostridia bacterium]|nr:DEAD/DEAH box helicase family protein [Clostridia bacterium]
MAQITLKTANHVVPMIYAYTTPEIIRHNGWTKIGYTEQDVEKRLEQQTHTADVEYNLEWKGNAIFDDGSGEKFTDHDFHAYLRKLGIEGKKGTEWFHITGPVSRGHFYDFRSNRGLLEQLDAVVPYTLRAEQEDAVSKTVEYARTHEKGEFLWNAKPRFGKTLSVYDFCKRMSAVNVLIVTNRPAIANSWYSDYEKFIGQESGYLFVSNTDSLKGKKYVLSRQEYLDAILAHKGDKCIEFVSLQDLKGSIYFGGDHDKLAEVEAMTWDVLVIDEAHEGIDTYKTDVAFDHIKRKFTLHLSGTPFKALANDKFPENAIYNWTYADEQRAKRDWTSEEGTANPYATLPKLNMFTYQMSEIVRDELEQGVEINGETEEYAFDLNVFFETKNGEFVHESSVDKFLDAMTTQTKFPFSTPELRAELKHTFWLLNRVDSAKALAKKLKEHPVFKDYEIILAAGDGKLNEEEETKKSFDRVVEAIAKHEKTITLSVGQLTTGITVPEWSAVLMLSNIKSPALYMQAAFRAQNPCLFKFGGQHYRKENAYVFDFDPARTLTIYEAFANDLSAETSDGRGDSDMRKEHIRELLNFFPVIGEDEEGEMVELDAEKVLSIPRKIRSQEVVRRGFMSDYLFQNISNVFHAPQAVIDIITTFQPVEEPKGKLEVTHDTAEELSLDENGEVKLTDDFVIGRTTEIFGPKIYDDIGTMLIDTVQQIDAQQPKKQDETLEKLKNAFHQQAVKPLLDTAKTAYTGDMKKGDRDRLERKLNDKADGIVGRAFGDFSITQKKLEQERQDLLEICSTAEEKAEVNQEFEEKKQQAVEDLKQTLSTAVEEFVQEAGTEVVRTVETQKKEEAKKGVEDKVRDHLRGFSRTIPSFLMAYGTDEVTLDTFDQVIPDQVFRDVTSITLDQFRFLRDGGPYIDDVTGEQKHFGGKLFDPVVFDDSVREFMRLRRVLANYFDEANTEDIFDYIPPQKTNQIFTPKWVVKKMVDHLEEENPGCFDDPSKTFIDMYMKSGLYITEIVKRLYQSAKMKELFPDGAERLRHIFANQVYGLAPTEIIYQIAKNFILGFADDVAIEKHNLRLLDSLEYAKTETLEAKLEEVFGK